MTDKFVYAFPVVDKYFNPFPPRRPSSADASASTATTDADPQMLSSFKRLSLLNKEMEELRRRLKLLNILGRDNNEGFTAKYFGVPRLTSASPYYLLPSLETTIDASSADGKSTEPGIVIGRYVLNISLGNLGQKLGAEDLKVSVKDHVMTVEAKKEQKSPDGSTRIYREYMRKFTLPENVDMKEVKSVLTADGYLKIEAPLPRPESKGDWEHVTNPSDSPTTTESEENNKPSRCFPT